MFKPIFAAAIGIAGRDGLRESCEMETASLYGGIVELGMNARDLAIGMLSVTAVVLLTAILLIQVLAPTPAYGFAQSSSAAPYIAATSQIDEFQEVLVLIDSRSELMNVYAYAFQNGTIRLVQQFDLRENDED